MSKYILFDDAGLLVARYDDEVNSSIPEGAIEVDGAVWQQTYEEQDGQWFIDRSTGKILKSILQPTPEDQIARLTAQINQWRDEQEAAGVKFDFDGHRYDGGEKSRLRLQDSVASGIAASDQFFWTDEANEDVPMNADSLAGLHSAMIAARVQRGFQIHVRQRQMKEEIAAMDVEALQAYQVGWPSPPETTDPDQPA